jgi:UrcA family protein
MNTRNTACIAAAIFVGVGLTATATHALGAPPRTIVVAAKHIDPMLQRRVSFADLNLAVRSQRSVLRGRIWRTAGELCFDLSGIEDGSDCRMFAVRSTHRQFAAAVARAERKMAGLPVGPAVAISMVITSR